jgi:hypothetical protein
MPSGQSSVSEYRDSLIKVLRFSSESNLHFVLLIKPLIHCLLLMTGILLTFSAITRRVLSVLAVRKSEKDFPGHWVWQFEEFSPLLLARCEEHILYCAVQTKRLRTATNSPVINPNFSWMLNILISSSVLPVWLFAHRNLKHQHSLCRTVRTESCKHWHCFRCSIRWGSPSHTAYTASFQQLSVKGMGVAN